MKIKLSQNQGVSTLEVAEEVKMTEFPALKAGLVKLLQSGKNRIIINLLPAKPLPMEAIHECLKLNAVASELKGNIVLVGQGDQIVAATQGMKTPEMKCFSAMDAALRYFTDQAEEAKKNAPPAAGDEELRKKVAALEQENTILKGKVSNSDAGELKKLKEENGNLKMRVGVMEKQIQTMTQEQKRPFDSEGLKTQIANLEKTLEENFAAPPAKKP